MIDPGIAGRWLWLLLGLFSLRVLAQLVQRLAPVPWLPPFEAWQGSRLPYGVLLGSQIAIMALQICLAWRMHAGRLQLTAGARWIWLGLGSLYLGSMALRLVLGLTVLAGDRWWSARLPTLFHLVLASFVLCVAAGARHRDTAGDPRGPRFRALRTLTLVLIALASAGCQTYVQRFVLPREEVRPAEHAVDVERGLRLRTADGVDLVADVYRPRGLPRVPAVLVRIPFTSTLYNRLGADAVGHFWASRGYAAVIQGTRGRFRSGGAFYPLWHERDDGIETLRWLAAQPWFDGRLGMWGGSAFGHTQWAIADQGDPGPDALFIQIASTGFGEMFHPGGAFALESALTWALRSRIPGEPLPDPALIERAAKGFPLTLADDRGGANVPFFDDWALHAPDSAYWQSIDGQGRARDLAAPVLLMGGWFDPFLPTQLRDHAQIQAHAQPRVAEGSRLIIGPWSHADAVRFPDGSRGDAYRPASLAPSIGWFDHWLRDLPLPASLQTSVRIYVMGENVWRDEREWPLARAVPTPFYLSSGGHAASRSGDGALQQQALAAAEPADRFRFDPRDPVPSRGGAMLGPRAGMLAQQSAEDRADVLVYSSAALERDMEVTGPLQVVLHVSTSAPSTDFTAKLVDVHPDGRAYHVSGGILRRSYAGEGPHEIAIELQPTSMLFRAGHRLRVQISSSDHPLYACNPNTGEDPARASETTLAEQAVHHGGAYPSRIILPVIPR